MFVPLNHVPLGHHKQVKWELGKRSELLLFRLSLQTYFIFCSVKRLTLWYMTAHRITVVLLPGLSVLYVWWKKRLCSPARLLRVSSQALVIAVVHIRMSLPTHVFTLHVLPKTRVGLFSFVFLVLFFPKAFQIAPLKVALKMSLVKMKGKFHLTFFPFDISIGLGLFVFNFSAP